MPTQVVQFGTKAARRIGEAVRHVERMRVADAKRRRPMLPTAEGLFLVTLESDGGSGGTGGSPIATWTYSVWYAADDTATADPIIETASPMKRLPGILAEATQGIGTFDSDGTFVLWDTNEAPDPDQCS